MDEKDLAILREIFLPEWVESAREVAQGDERFMAVLMRFFHYVEEKRHGQ